MVVQRVARSLSAVSDRNLPDRLTIRPKEPGYEELPGGATGPKFGPTRHGVRGRITPILSPTRYQEALAATGQRIQDNALLLSLSSKEDTLPRGSFVTRENGTEYEVVGTFPRTAYNVAPRMVIQERGT